MEAFYSSGQPMMVLGDFGGGQRHKTCTAATLGQLLGICEPEASGGWLWCSKGEVVTGRALVEELNLY